jgi:hypothetical protein
MLIKNEEEKVMVPIVLHTAYVHSKNHNNNSACFLFFVLIVTTSIIIFHLVMME